QMDQGPAVSPQAEEKAGSGVTHPREAAEDLRSAAGASADKHLARAEGVWHDARHRVRSFQDDGEQYVRENPTKAIFAALGIRIGLDEDRMLVLVVQVLIGFDYKAVFEAKFVELPVLLQYLKLFSLAAQLITLMLLLAIPSYHRIAEQGENSAHFCRVIKRLMAIALFPFAFSFGAVFA